MRKCVGKIEKLLASLVLALLYLLMDSTNVYAKYEDKCFIAGGFDSEGSVISVAPAFVLNLGDERYILSSPLVLDGSPEAFVLVMPSEDDMYYDIEYTGADQEYTLFTFPDEEPPTSQMLEVSQGQQGETVDFVYLDKESADVGYFEVQLAAAEDSGFDLIRLDITDFDSEDLLAPAALIDQSGSLVGFYTGSGILGFGTLDDFYKDSDPRPIQETQADQPTEDYRESSSPNLGWDTAQQEEGEDGAEETTLSRTNSKTRTGNGGVPWILIVLVIAGILILAAGVTAILVIGLKNKKKTKPSTGYPAQQQCPPVSPQPGGQEPPFHPTPADDGSRTMPLRFVKPASPAQAVPQPQPVTVLGTGGYMRGRVYPVERNGVTFGRDASCMARFPADTKGVSRIHCKLFWDAQGTLQLMDCGSRYGTVLQGYGKLSPQQPATVKKGSVFFLGSERESFTIQ